MRAVRFVFVTTEWMAAVVTWRTQIKQAHVVRMESGGMEPGGGCLCLIVLAETSNDESLHTMS
jgi:hypothetical protein